MRGRVFGLAAGAANSAALLLRSDVANSSGLVGSRYMMHNNTHIAAIDPRRTNDVVFQKTACINDFYEDMGDGYPGGTLQLIGKVQASMMKTHATRAPMAMLKPMLLLLWLIQVLEPLLELLKIIRIKIHSSLLQRRRVKLPFHLLLPLLQQASLKFIQAQPQCLQH